MVGYSNATFHRNNGIKCFNQYVTGCTQPGWSWNAQLLNRRRGGSGVLTCLEKTAMSSLKDSEEQTSPPATPGSRGVQVANSHFSKIRASRGNRGWLQQNKVFYQLAQTVSAYTTAILIYGNVDFENSREFGICHEFFISLVCFALK